MAMKLTVKYFYLTVPVPVYMSMDNVPLKTMKILAKKI